MIVSEEYANHLWCAAIDRFPDTEAAFLARLLGDHTLIQPLVLRRLQWMLQQAVNAAVSRAA